MEPVSSSALYQETYKRAEFMRTLDFLNFKTPVHIAVPGKIFRNNTETLAFHRLPANMPENSFIRIDESMYIASPEYCFLQAANEMTLQDAVTLACDLCAIYIKDKYEEYGQRRREIITSTEQISGYLDHAKNIHGINKAKRAITYALNRANSPMESRLATIIMLPLFCGGYGLIKPELNKDVLLSENGAAHLGRPVCCCDMVWEKQKIVLEYDSNLSHLSIKQHYKDKKRATALGLSDYKVIQITAADVQSFRPIENLFFMIRNALGQRTFPDRWDKYYDKRWKVVRNVMFGINDDRPYT